MVHLDIFPSSGIFQSVAPTLIPVPTRLASSLFAFRSATTFPKFLSLLRPPSTPHAVLGLFSWGSEACAWYTWVELMIADAHSIKLMSPHICHILLQQKRCNSLYPENRCQYVRCFLYSTWNQCVFAKKNGHHTVCLDAPIAKRIFDQTGCETTTNTLWFILFEFLAFNGPMVAQ